MTQLGSTSEVAEAAAPTSWAAEKRVSVGTRVEVDVGREGSWGWGGGGE